jgi:hypothetical protein
MYCYAKFFMKNLLIVAAAFVFGACSPPFEPEPWEPGQSEYCPLPSAEFCGADLPEIPSILPQCPEGQSIDGDCVSQARVDFMQEMAVATATACAAGQEVMSELTLSLIMCPDDGPESRACINDIRCAANEKMKAIRDEYDAALANASAKYGIALAACCNRDFEMIP